MGNDDSGSESIESLEIKNIKGSEEYLNSSEDDIDLESTLTGEAKLRGSETPISEEENNEIDLFKKYSSDIEEISLEVLSSNAVTGTNSGKIFDIEETSEIPNTIEFIVTAPIQKVIKYESEILPTINIEDIKGSAKYFNELEESDKQPQEEEEILKLLRESINPVLEKKILKLAKQNVYDIKRRNKKLIEKLNLAPEDYAKIEAKRKIEQKNPDKFETFEKYLAEQRKYDKIRIEELKYKYASRNQKKIPSSQTTTKNPNKSTKKRKIRR